MSEEREQTMAQQKPWIVAGGMLAAFAFGLITGQAIPSGEHTARDDAQLLIAPDRRSGGEQAEDTPRRPFQLVREEDAPRPAPLASDEFSFQRLDIRTQSETPQACLQFSQALDNSGNVSYGDFVRVEPSTKPAIEVAGQFLCLSGLNFDTDYTVQLRPGLPSAGDDSLARGERVVVAFGDKPAYVGFSGDGVVLPRFEADGLGIETVNVEKLEVTVLRVSDRSLARKQIVKGQSLGENDYFYAYDAENGEDIGAPVYKGELEVEGERNQAAITVFALGAALDEVKPGAYFVRIKDVSPGADKRRTAQAWRWIMFTDMALSTYTGADGVDVVVRSLATARPLVGVELSLIASNNDILAKAKTNADGMARFSGEAVNGGYPLTPRMIMAYGQQDDFAAIDLQRAPLDLSERNVGGRAAPSKMDGFIYFDRGIYRPGETAFISGIIRDDAGLAIESRPVTVKIYRPNNTIADEIRLSELDVGGFSLDYNLAKSAARGVWRVNVDADGIGKVGSKTFSVEDFVPQRLEVKLDVDEETPIRAGTERRVNVVSRFLYGAPATGLEIEAEARLRLDPNPFPDLNGYRYGPVDGRFNERFINLSKTVTDEEGASTFPFAITDMPKKLGVPLRADLVVGVVEPGGRVVRESARIPVRPDEAYVGLKLGKDGASGFGQDEPAQIEAVLVNYAGDRMDGELEWRLVEEDYWFDWYRENGAWRWRRSYKDVLISEGRDSVTAQSSASIAQQLDAGSYRISVTDPATGARTSQRFYVGWRSYESGADTPDQASFTRDEEPMTPGARAKLKLVSPYEGEAIITVATDRVHSVQRLKVDKNGTEIAIDTDPSWGAGFYVLASIVTPRDVVEQPVPRRAMAVEYVPFDMSDRTLSLALEAPAKVEPRQSIDIGIAIDGAEKGEEVNLTLAAVDEGILRLTKFASPDPLEHFYGKHRLGIELRDDYSRLLHANLGAANRFGGDQIGGEGLTVVPTKSVALFSGLVTLDKNGRATVPVSIPDFNGELRLMAVAWSAKKLGKTAEPMTVRDSAPALLALPRFLAPSDRSSATLSIDNVDAPAGAFTVRLSSRGPIAIDTEEVIELAKGERKTRVYDIIAQEAGIGAVVMQVSGPDGYSVTQEYPIQVRTPFYPVTNRSTSALNPGEIFVASSALIDNFAPGTGEVNVSFSRLLGIEPGGLLDALYRYPYGCSEQLTSTAMPLLYSNVLGGDDGRDPDRAIRPRVQKAINTLLSRQGSDGAFGLWREGDGYASPWIGAYVTDFLVRAKLEGYGVPDDALERAFDALAKVAQIDRWTGVRYQMRAYQGTNSTDTTELLRRRAGAYALYVLARVGRADLSDLRYFHDALLEKTPNPLARAHIAAALALMGDTARSVNAFKEAERALGYENRSNYYQTPLRDVAGVLAIASEAGRNEVVERVSESFENQLREPERLHTQEKAFVLLAAQALLRAAGPLTISVDGEKIEGISAPSISPAIRSLVEGVSFQNLSDGPIFRTVTASGAPLSPPLPVANGYEVSKTVLTREGKAVDLNSIKQNDRLVIVLRGKARADRLHPTIVADLLPPGLEIETVLKPQDGALTNSGRNRDSSGKAGGAYRFVGSITRTKVAEARDDRFVAALDVRDESFTLAYVVRAVTSGKYLMPGVVIEDMYRPGEVGRSAAGTITVTGQ